MLSLSVDLQSLQSLFHSVVSVLRWVALGLVILNYRAFPFVWHLEVFWNIIVERVLMVYTILGADLRRAYVKKRSPIGANPFDLTVTYKTIVGFSDLDYNIHLSNSSYAKILDIARMRAVLTWFPSLLEAGTRLGLGASHFHFLKEIPAGTEYEIRLNIVGWEEKWMHVVAQYVTYPKRRTGLAPIRPQMSRAGTSVPSNAFVTHTRPLVPVTLEPQTSSTLLSPPLSPRPEKNALGLEDFSAVTSETCSRSPSDDEDVSPSSTAAASVSSASPVMSSKPLLTVDDLKEAMSTNAAASTSSSSALPESWRINTLPEIPSGGVLHCVHVSSYCFKHNRITVPPRVAMVASGFGDVSKRRWERVQEIRNSRAHQRRESSSSTGGVPNPPANAFSFIAPGTGAAAAEKKRKFGGLREILLGGWKRYEEEGLWNLPEYEERRRIGVERFSPLRMGLIALQE